MKKILYLILAALVATAATAQIYRGESDAFWLQSNGQGVDMYIKARSYLDKNGNLTKNALTFIVQSYNAKLPISDKFTVEMQMADGENLTFNAAIIDFQKSHVEGNICYTIDGEVANALSGIEKKVVKNTKLHCGDGEAIILYPIEKKKVLKKEIEGVAELAFSQALRAKAARQPLRPKLPTHVELYLKEKYNATGALCEFIDTIEYPVRILMSLEFIAKIDAMRTKARLEEIFKKTEGEQIELLKKEVEKGDSLLAAMNACMHRIDSILEKKEKNTTDDYHNYQRVRVSLGENMLDVYTRVGEDKPSAPAMEFERILNNVKKEIEDFNGLIGRARIRI